MNAVGRVISPWQVSGLRDVQWLQNQLAEIWAGRFPDMPRVNEVEIGFSSGWKSRLGVISLSVDSTNSYIGINSLLSLPEAPEKIARITIAHELVHYLHGFGSPLPRRHRHPHRGHVVEKELFARGFYEEFKGYEEWIRDNWYDFYERCALSPSFVAGRPVSVNSRETYESQ
jgi:hypothetical protein